MKRNLCLPVGSVCKVETQDPENFDEEVKSLVTAWLISKSKEAAAPSFESVKSSLRQATG